MSIADHRPTGSKPSNSVIIQPTFKRSCSWERCWLNWILNKPPFPIWNSMIGMFTVDATMIGISRSELASDLEDINNYAAGYIRNISNVPLFCLCDLMGIFILIAVICYLVLPKPDGPAMMICCVIGLLITFCCFYKYTKKVAKDSFDGIETFIQVEINPKYFPRGVIWSLHERPLLNPVNQETIRIEYDICIATFNQQDVADGYVIVAPQKESTLLISGFIREFEQQHPNELMHRVPVEVVELINLMYGNPKGELYELYSIIYGNPKIQIQLDTLMDLRIQNAMVSNETVETK